MFAKRQERASDYQGRLAPGPCGNGRAQDGSGGDLACPSAVPDGIPRASISASYGSHHPRQRDPHYRWRCATDNPGLTAPADVPIRTGDVAAQAAAKQSAAVATSARSARGCPAMAACAASLRRNPTITIGPSFPERGAGRGVHAVLLPRQRVVLVRAHQRHRHLLAHGRGGPAVVPA